MKKILFVCNCNICRSPMAEFIMKHLLTDRSDIEIASAGVSAQKLGQDMDEGAKACLTDHEIPFTERSATLFKAEDYTCYDKIICMDEWTKLSLQMKCANDPAKKLCKLLDFADRVKAEMTEEERMLATEIYDPFHSRNFEKSFADIYEGCLGLKKYL